MASSSSSCRRQCEYDVFLNFRGEDTRKIFVCHLHSALSQKLLNVFIDDEDLRIGNDLSDLLNAITDSKISIVVFSQNYASSTWCLKELAQIMKCKEEQEQIVVPVFYQVDPSDIRKQKGTFGEAFVKHESNQDLQLEEVQSWRLALTEAVNLSGLDSRRYKDDAKLIVAIVDRVCNEWFRISSSKNNYLVGMDSRLDKMRQLLRLGMDSRVLRVGIWGMGGIGKTTIATEVYEEIRSQFDHCSFLRAVKEGFSRDPVGMQKQLLYGILKKDDRIDTVYDGYKIMKRLSKKKVLFVLDDVDSRDQIETLLGPEPSFGGGSRIIVTTRDDHLLNGFDKRYEAELLSEGDAGTLFNQFAFKSNKPSKEYDHLSKLALKYAQGLPLALKILGSHLVGRSVDEWKEELLEKLKKFPKLENVLRVSFDGLDELTKKLFLDVACFFPFFKRMGKDYVINVLGGRDGFHPLTGLKVLVEKALITLSKFGGLESLEMHDLLQEIGKGIVQSEKPWKHTRLWNYEDVQDVLTRNKATKVEGIMLELPNSGDICLVAEAFASMTNLRLLIINYSHYSNQFEGEAWRERLCLPNNCKQQQLTGNLKFLPLKLRVLVWHGYPLKFLPSNFDPKNLIALDMRYSHIEQLWKETKSVKELISINLSSCKYLNKIPPCIEATKLERLIIEGCKNLLEVDPSIGALENLVFLSLAGCGELKTLPNSIVHLKSLKCLDLTWCVNLEIFPEIWEDMEALSELQLHGTAFKELPSSIERFRRLESLLMTNCRSLVCLPESICNLAELRILNLMGCPKLCNLPENLGKLESLWELQVNFTGLEQLPVSILRLKLGRLRFEGCKQMEAPFSSWPSSIEGPCTAVVHIDFGGCKLLELPDAIAHFSSLKILRLAFNNLESLPVIMNRLVCLEQLDLGGCKRLKSIPELSSSISYINARNCTSLETVSTPKCPYNIGRCFKFSNCSQLVQEDIFRDIVETHSPPQGNYSRPFYMCFPGSEIPGWFRHQCRGSSLTAQLPLNWFDNKFLGFAICAVTTEYLGGYYIEPVRCFCTFKGNHCEYQFSFYLFDDLFSLNQSLESNHMLLGYVPWSELGINGGEEVNERRYTEATFEVLHGKAYFGQTLPSIEWCGVRFFFSNDEEVSHQDFGVPMVHSERSLEGCSAEPITNDEDEQYLKLSELFDGANRNSREYDSESDCEIEDDDSSGKRKILSRWTQHVRVTSGLMQGLLDDGFSWNSNEWSDLRNGYFRSKYSCKQTSCYAKSKKIVSSSDPTILEITYIGRHTCWKTQPMLTDQVRVKPGMGPEGPFDGFSWRKYGQKDFLGVKYPRAYYVCIPQNVRGCMAIKEVQLSDDDPKILKITYRGRHTCIQASTICIGGRDDGRISEGSGALRIHDQVGDNGSGGNVIRLADRTMDGNNANILPDANSQDMEHFQDVNYMANKDVAGYPNYGGVVSEGTSEAVVNQLEEEDPMVKLNAFFVRLGNCCCSFLHCFGILS